MFKIIVTILLTVLLTACGGDSSTSAPTTPVVIPPPPPPPEPSPISTDTTGVITGFGSVFVNGVEYETSTTEVSTDDKDSASETDLQVGMVISLKGAVNNDGKTGTAEAIHYKEQIKGPLNSIDLAASTLIILGQTVLFDELTSLDNVILANLAPGDFLEISGFTNADNQLYATRIAKEEPVDTLKVEGIISMLDTSAKTFKLANLIIDYNNADFVNLTEVDLVNDLTVRVKGDVSALVNDVFTVNQIKVEINDHQHNEGDNRHLEGVITRFDSSTSFVVNDVNVITDSNTEYEHGSVDSLALNLRVKIKGAFNAEGKLLAKEIRIHRRTELKLEGAIQAIDLENKTITILDVIFITDEQTKMRDESDQGDRFFSLSDLLVGDFIEVKGFVDSNGDNFATKLERKNEDTNHDRELKGTVSNINIDTFSFSVVDVVINTTENTLFEGLDGDGVVQAIFFEQLTDGMHVEIKGNATDSGFNATKAKIEDEREGDHGGGNGGGNGNHNHRTEFRGTIESLADTSFVVSGHTVNIVSTTEYEVNDGMIANDEFWALVKVGDQVKVKGMKDPQGIITAKKISLEIEHQDNVAEVELQAAGSFIENNLMVAEHHVEITQDTDFKNKEGEINFDDFIAQANEWQNFKVTGTLRDNVIFARKVEQKDPDENTNIIELAAFIEAFTDNGVTVAGHTVIFNNSTDFVANESSLTRDEFITQAVLNAKVKIKGVLTFETQSDGTNLELITANKVELKTQD